MSVILYLRFGVFRSADEFLALCLRLCLFVLLLFFTIYFPCFLLLQFNSLFLSVIFNPISLHRAKKAVSVSAPLGRLYLSEERGNPMK